MRELKLLSQLNQSLKCLDFSWNQLVKVVDECQLTKKNILVKTKKMKSDGLLFM